MLKQWLCGLLGFVLGSSVLWAAPSDKPYRLVVATMFCDEAPWLREWVEYHRLVGVDHFILYNNGSKDGWREVLAPYLQEGLVEVHDWPTRKGPHGWVILNQRPAMEDALRRLRKRAHWVSFLDIDEFLLPLQHDDAPSFLAAIERDIPKVGAVFVSWVRYGTSQVWDLLPGDTMIERLTWHGDAAASDHQGKVIVKPEAVHRVAQVHDVELKRGFIAVRPNREPHQTRRVGTLGNGQPLNMTNGGNYDVAVINHYELRTERYYAEEKIPKKLAMDGKLFCTVWGRKYEELNLIHDDLGPIGRFVPALREKLCGGR